MTPDPLVALVDLTGDMVYDEQGRLVIDTAAQWRQWFGQGPRRTLPGMLAPDYRVAVPAALTSDIATWVARLPLPTRIRLRLRKAWREVTHA